VAANSLYNVADKFNWKLKSYKNQRAC